jgi:hypothetical protein
MFRFDKYLAVYIQDERKHNLKCSLLPDFIQNWAFTARFYPKLGIYCCPILYKNRYVSTSYSKNFPIWNPKENTRNAKETWQS